MQDYLFNLSQLVRFGEFLLSEERQERILDKENLRHVTDADLANFIIQEGAWQDLTSLSQVCEHSILKVREVVSISGSDPYEANKCCVKDVKSVPNIDNINI